MYLLKWGGYTVIIGHRRLAAAKLAGLLEVPCVITEMSEKEQLQTMLIENVQRSDLTAFEQAQGFQMMIDMGDTAEEVARKTGFSKTTVRRRLKMAELDPKVLQEVSSRQVSLADFDKLAQIEDIRVRNKCLKEIGTNNFNSMVESAIKKAKIKKSAEVARVLVKELKAKKISRSDTWGGKFDRLGDKITLSSWDRRSHPIKADETRKIFYNLDEDYNELSFYVERPKAKPVRRSKAEIEREKLIEKTHSDIAELNALHYKLRKDFVAGLSVTSKNMELMLKGAAMGIVERKFGSIPYSTGDSADVAASLGITLEEGYDPDRAKKMIAAFDTCPDLLGALPRIIYTIFNDSETRNWNSTYKTDFPKHYESSSLDTLYKWLCSLGYEMSDDEISLQNGTHKLLSYGKNKQ